MNYKDKLMEYAAEVETALDGYLPQKSGPQADIYKAMRYSLLGGGKRIRGVLALVCCELSGGKKEKALPFAAAVEMIHAYSLIHDDLPAMDNDDMRRGKPSNHIAFGEAMAILAGDGLLGEAMNVILKNAEDMECAWRAMKVLANAYGPEGMLGGQVMDMQAENKQISYDELLCLQQHKTGALIKAACLMGAIVGGADEKMLAKLESYAEKIGLAFQIKDDILDIESTDEELGKNTGSDKEQGKSTFVSLCGLEEAKLAVKRLSREAAQLFPGEGMSETFLRETAEYLAVRTN
ncbi:MAG: polyprenyl synthetase family protein [Clostridia bacterium]|nr:polyprenyl synthetase family protein [Clostridia bacterium]